MGFAHVLDKPIFLYYPMPQTDIKDEIIAMQPKVINGNLEEIVI